MGTRFLLVAHCLVLLCLEQAFAREWKDSTGKFKIKADLITYSDHLVVLQRGDKTLVAVPVDKLSSADQEFVKAKLDETTPATADSQTWTLRNGQKVLGKVVDYARRRLVVQRRRGSVYVNDRALKNVPRMYQQILPRIVGHFESTTLETPEELSKWIVGLKGEARSYDVEGVLMELENGDEVGVPFFFLLTRTSTFCSRDGNIGWPWRRTHKSDPIKP